jgi:DNA recombination protein RmuC
VIGRLRADLQSVQVGERKRADELAEARREGETWRGKLEFEQLERTRFETEARRVAGLDAELQQLRSRAEALAVEKSALQIEADRVRGLEAHVSALGNDATELRTANAQLQTQLQEQALAHAEKIVVLTEVRGEIEKDLKNITADALRANQGTFLQLANEVFEKHKAGAEADLEARQKAVQSLIVPLQETLQTYKQQVDEMEKARSHSYGVLSAELKGVVEAQSAVRTETSKLVNALRAAPKTRGRWGEHTLRNVLELSGLSSYCDYSTEESFERDGSVSRPDVVIRLPGGRSIVVDAKTSLSAYLDAVDAIDDVERDRHFARHATQIRTPAISAPQGRSAAPFSLQPACAPRGARLRRGAPPTSRRLQEQPRSRLPES